MQTFRQFLLTISIVVFFSACTTNDSIEEYTDGGGVVLTFDDVFVDEWYAADDVMAAYNWKATFFVTKYAELTNQQKEKLHTLNNHGHEIGGHGLNHIKATEYIAQHGIDTYIDTEITPMLEMMQNDGFDIKTFAYPYGDRSPQTDEKLCNYFDIVRATTYGQSKPEKQTCYYRKGSKIIYALGMDDSYHATTDYLISLLKYAKQHNKIVILYGHKIVNSVNSSYETPVNKLKKICEYAHQNNMTFYTVDELKTLQ